MQTWKDTTNNHSSRPHGFDFFFTELEVVNELRDFKLSAYLEMLLDHRLLFADIQISRRQEATASRAQVSWRVVEKQTSSRQQFINPSSPI